MEFPNVDHYPDHEQLCPEVVLCMAEGYFEKRDYGAAMFFGKVAQERVFLAMQGLQKIPDIPSYAIHANTICNLCWDIFRREVIDILEDSSITVNEENVFVLLQEYSHSYFVFDELANKYGLSIIEESSGFF